MPALLEAKGLHAAYGDTKVLHGIDFSIEEGGVIQSLNAGESWRYVSKGEAETFRAVSRVTGVYQDCHVVRISPHDPDSLFLTTGDGLYRSDDCGKSWRRHGPSTRFCSRAWHERWRAWKGPAAKTKQRQGPAWRGPIDRGWFSSPSLQSARHKA